MSRNQLDQESSPYLLQHKDNPVHWYGWNPETLDRARDEDKPILLSIGYAACHWCHVMAHESFEDPEIATLMNENFINIKVDREERPDIDKIYMAALHALGEQGGWPLTIFLDSSGRPFWGGTYFPPVARYGRPSFRHVLTEIARIWRDERAKVDINANAVLSALASPPRSANSGEFTRGDIEQAADAVCKAVDVRNGGLAGAPKFPQAPVFDFLWSASLHPHHPHRATAVLTTLECMCQGGIYDHLGGGMARYSVDDRWLVPHFEKMLYDNAQLVSLLTRSWLGTGRELFHRRIDETVRFVLSDMTTPNGTFASSFDADSEGVEGRYYVWEFSEIQALLGPVEAELFCRHYGVAVGGNWEGHNILSRSLPMDENDAKTEARLEAARTVLLASRRRRTSPGFDDKVLVDWNGLMIAALAEAGWVFQRPDWIAAAQRALEALLQLHWRDGRLLHASRHDRARHEATADDYANLIAACRALHWSTARGSYAALAATLAAAVDADHWDDAEGGYSFASRRVRSLPFQPPGIHDDATPNANAVMIANLAFLHVHAGKDHYLRRAQRISESFAPSARASPFAAPTYLKNLRYLNDCIQLLATADVPHVLLRHALRYTGLDIVIQRVGVDDAGLTANPVHKRFPSARGPAIYLCRGSTCAAPVHDESGLIEALELLGLRDARSGIH
jgi:hypothetical protein